jgi:DNA (cytosine-5)-methyltransferase 1
MTVLTVGSLCTGYAGLERGMELAGWPVELVWVADNDPAAARLLAHRHPGVPNLGDITRVEWAAGHAVDIVAAGFPCQDVSAAGRRAGLGAGTRSGVWAHVVRAVAALRPRFVLIENVAALLSTPANRSTNAQAVRDMEPGPAGVGDRPGRPVLRALGAVLGDLAGLGFDAEWISVPASGVGACHQRKRVFVLAWPADAEGYGHRDPWPTGGQRVPAAAVAGAVRPGRRVDLLPTPNATDGQGGVRAVPERRTHGGTDHGPRLRDVAPSLLPTPGARLGDSRGTPSSDTAGRRLGPEGRRNLEDAVALLPTPAARDGKSGKSNIMDRNARPLNEVVVNLLPTPTARLGQTSGNAERDDRATRTSTGGDLADALTLLPTPRATDGTNGGPNQRGSSGDLMLPSAVMELLPTPVAADAGTKRGSSAGNGPRNTSREIAAYADRWGRYAPAIARWEQVLGRPAPEPTEPGSKGQPRLSPRFVEWMQGLPDGWVTAVPELSRSDMLRLLGNGPVPLQCVPALRALLARCANGSPP